MSSLINKAKAALHSDKSESHSTTHNTHGSTNHGTHDSNLANKADPRFDSDLDHRNNPTSTYGNTSSGGAYTSSTTNASGGYDNPKSTNAGPHGSNVLNKVDPRVDSDRDNRNDPTSRVGGYGAQEGYGGQGANPNPSSGGYGHTSTTGGIGGHSGAGGIGHSTHGTTGAYDNSGYNAGSTNAGPHNSNLMNKADPRVDSDLDNRNNPTSRVGGYGAGDNYGSGPGGVSSTTGHHGTHGTTGLGQDNYGRGATAHDTTTSGGFGTAGGAGYNSGANYGSNTASGYGSSHTPGSGNADKTAGPHNSNLLNKLDPRVDSDADGSKTVGGNKTYQ